MSPLLRSVCVFPRSYKMFSSPLSLSADDSPTSLSEQVAGAPLSGLGPQHSLSAVSGLFPPKLDPSGVNPFFPSPIKWIRDGLDPTEVGAQNTIFYSTLHTGSPVSRWNW